MHSEAKTSIILVGPQMGENIGAVARAMKNWGLDDLRIVKPRDPWPNEKARAMAVGAVNIIDQARIFPDLSSAVYDLQYLYAASAGGRNLNKPYIYSKDLASEKIEQLKLGIIFGRENSGLTNAEIALANKILIINTVKDFSSLNLAHAVAIICYQIFTNSVDKVNNSPNIEVATRKDIDFFVHRLFSCLDERGFFQLEKKKNSMFTNLTNSIYRFAPITKSEVNSLHGILNILTKSDKK